MNFAWIFFLFITTSDGLKTRRTKFTIEPSTVSNNVNDTHKLSRRNSEIQNITQPPHSAPSELSIKNRLMPKIQINKDVSVSVEDSTLGTTTRRPLMPIRKFTSKPHAIHIIHSRTQGERSNFSKRRNLNGKKRFKPQNKNKSTPNSSENSSSVEDRFQNFTDIDDIHESGDQKRKVSSNRQLNRLRGYPLATAASEKVKSVAAYTLPNTNKYRSKSKSAIQESLQKIKTIRPGMIRKVIPTKTVPAKIKDNITSSEVNTTEENKTIINSEKLVHSESTTAKLVQFTTMADELVYLPLTTEKSILSTTTTKKMIYLPITTERSIFSTITIKNIHEPLNKTKQNVNSTTTLEMLHDALTTTEKSSNIATTSVNIDSSVTKTEITDLSTSITSNLDDTVTYTGKYVDLATTIKTLDESETKTEKSVDSAVTTEIFDNNSIIVTEKPVHPANKLEISDKSDSETVKSVELIIVTGKSIHLSDINDTFEEFEPITNSNIVTSTERTDPEFMNKTEENIIVVTPISNEEEITTTEGVGNHSALRRKRRINIIEEERAATPSTGHRFIERETHVGADLTYRNIHT